MSEILGLRWENQQLHGVEATVGRGKVRIDRCFVLEWPEGSKPSEQPRLAGSWLKEELLRRGVVAKQVAVALPREEAVIRPLDLPDAPDSELPELVRLQAATKSTVPLDRLLLDYLPLPKQPGAAGRTVLMATITRQLADRIRTVLEGAGLETVSIGIGAAGAAELIVREELRRGDDAGGERLVIARRGTQVEFAVLSKRNLVFTHTTRLSGSTIEQQNQAILAELSRSLVALQRTITGVKITRAWILGSADENLQLAESLAQRLSCDVRQGFDPLSAADVELKTADVPGSRGQYAGVVGMLLARTGGNVEAIDFLHPREPVVARGNTKRRLVLAGACVALLAVAGIGWYWSAVSSLQQSIAALRDRQQELTEYKNEHKEIIPSAQVIDDWDKRNVSWLEQAQKIGESLGNRDQMYLDRIQFSTKARGSIASLKIDGFAKGRPDSETLDRKLVERQFVVKPHAANVESNDSEYPYRVEVDVEIVEGAHSHAGP